MATASNVLDAMEEIKASFPVHLVVGSSGKLTAQISQGAPYHVFVAANAAYPARLQLEGFAKAKPRVYAIGKLALWKKQPDQPITKGKVAIANPNHAPYGVAAIEYLRAVGLYERVKNQLVYGENISQVNQFIYSRAVTAAFSSQPSSSLGGYWETLPTKHYSTIEQAAVLLHDSPKARAFYNFLFSQQARAIFKKFRYGLPKDAR